LRNPFGTSSAVSLRPGARQRLLFRRARGLHRHDRRRPRREPRLRGDRPFICPPLLCPPRRPRLPHRVEFAAAMSSFLALVLRLPSPSRCWSPWADRWACPSHRRGLSVPELRECLGARPFCGGRDLVVNLDTRPSRRRAPRRKRRLCAGPARTVRALLAPAALHSWRHAARCHSAVRPSS
jgi:hypothetical protein